MKRMVREPLIHSLLLGAALFVASAFLRDNGQVAGVSASRGLAVGHRTRSALAGAD
jgi:hypothetical protein